jgi:hypothetical protein
MEWAIQSQGLTLLPTCEQDLRAPVERLKNLLLILIRDADACILELDAGPFLIGVQGESHRPSRSIEG